MGDEVAPMSQFPQVARELMRMAGAGAIDGEEFRDTVREKFGLPLKDNEAFYERPVEIDLGLARASQEADEEEIGEPDEYES